MIAANQGTASAVWSAVALTLLWPAAPNPAAEPTSRPVSAYLPGNRAGRRIRSGCVRIDWQRPQVELDGEVVLREGPLELLACSPGTREHESIVAVAARPLHIRQALGLIGLEAGRPCTYDAAGDRWLPAAGDRLVIEVRYQTPGGTRTVNVWEWMIDTKHGERPALREWVFCGSRMLRENVFAADADGAVVCVVDFDTALIGLAETHSADNALLWVAANPEEVPPAGSPCTLLIRAAGEPDQGSHGQPTSRPLSTGQGPREVQRFVAAFEAWRLTTQLHLSVPPLKARETPSGRRFCRGRS